MWVIVSDLVWKFAQNFFVNGILPREVNEMLIVLVPKVPAPKELSQFRPITLCCILYKMLIKTIINKLKLILPNVVASN